MATMLLEFVDHDILNSRLVDVQSGQVQFKIVTRAMYGAGIGNGAVIVASRHTAIFDSQGLVAEIEWAGEEKKSGGKVQILGEEAINFTNLFTGQTTDLNTDDQLLIGTRLGYEWVATRDALRVRSVVNRTAVLEFVEQPGPSRKISSKPNAYGDRIRLIKLESRVIIELLVGFVFVNLMRRTRFNLPKYHFPLVDTQHETRQSAPSVLSHLKETFTGFRPLRRPTA